MPTTETEIRERALLGLSASVLLGSSSSKIEDLVKKARIISPCFNENEICFNKLNISDSPDPVSLQLPYVLGPKFEVIFDSRYDAKIRQKYLYPELKQDLVTLNQEYVRNLRNEMLGALEAVDRLSL